MGRQSQLQIDLTKSVLKSLREENMPWRSCRGIPTNPFTGNKYSGINLLILDAIATERKYRNKWWATYQQWHSVGMQVQRRPENIEEWGVGIVNWKSLSKFVDKGNIISLERFGHMQKHSVFNAEQVFGRDLKKYLISLNEYTNVDYSKLESFIQTTNAIVYHDDLCVLPHYHRPTDTIHLPLRESFVNDKQYFATQIHELFHWAESRLNWSGSEDQGEFIAEIGTGYLESEFDLPHDEDMTNCRTWLPAWISGIEKNPRYLFESAAQAAKGLEYLISLQPQKIMVESQS